MPTSEVELPDLWASYSNNVDSDLASPTGVTQDWSRLQWERVDYNRMIIHSKCPNTQMIIFRPYNDLSIHPGIEPIFYQSATEVDQLD